MRPDISYSYFYGFNFKPEFASKYEPENWAKAVVNEDFRKSIIYSLDKRALAEVYEPYNPDILLQKTITPETFLQTGGKDYTELDPFKNVTSRDSYDTTFARNCREVDGRNVVPGRIQIVPVGGSRRREVPGKGTASV